MTRGGKASPAPVRNSLRGFFAPVWQSAGVLPAPPLAAALTAALAFFAPAVSRPASAAPAELAFPGICDASAAVGLGDRWFVAASDEDSTLRLYDRERGGPPVATLDLAPQLQLAGRNVETDLEGAARLGDLVFWAGSHGRNRDGQARPNRHCLFATRIVPGEPPRLAFEGRPFTGLVAALAAEPALAEFDLARAATLSPETPGALNLESLGTGADGSLLLGFRSPVPGGRALVVPLLNPREVIAGRAPMFGPPLRPDLGGRGLRAMESVGGQQLIAAGHPAKGGDFAFFLWDGTEAAPRRLPGAAPRGFTIEALVVDAAAGLGRVLVLSDDDSRRIGGVPCQELKDPLRRQFRGAWLALE